MTTRAEKQRRSRNRAAAVGATRAAKAGVSKETKPKASPIPTQNGLQWLAAKNRLNRPQRQALEAYGVRYRLDVLGGSDSLKSCLEAMPQGGGVGIPEAALETAAWITEGKKQLVGARAALGFHAGMIGVCDLICGQGLRPREITAEQREADEIETTLRLSGDLLHKYFKEIRVL